MKLVSVIRREVPENLRSILVMNVLSAIAITTLLWTIGQASQDVAAGKPRLQLLGMYGISILLLAVTHKYVLVTAAEDTERLVHRIRIRLFDSIRKADLTVIEALGRPALFRALSQDTQILSGSLPLLGIAVQQSIMLLFLGAYLAWMSPLAFAMAAAFAAIAILTRFRRTHALRQSMKKSAAAGSEVFGAMNDLLRGFKEIRMDPVKATAAVKRHAAASETYRTENIGIKSRWGRNFAMVEALLYLQIGIMVFAVPLLTTNLHLVVAQATTVVLFIVGPVGTLAYVTPMLSQAELALDHIDETEAKLASAETAEIAPTGDVPAKTLDSISLENATFSYRDTDGTPIFLVGPLSLKFKAGEIAFVTGGNGSGKSTMLRLLTGLLPLQAGRLALNGATVAPSELQAYRDRMSVIFSDFHLSRRLYGINSVDPERAQALLREFELAHKVQLSEGQFSTIDLSAGQRRRLAMVVTLLENKPIMVLDEWAADQDPHFRRYFYETLLPRLRGQGKIIICVTHDDRWFSVADRIFSMEEGTIT